MFDQFIRGRKESVGEAVVVRIVDVVGYKIVEDGFEVFEFPIMEGVDAERALDMVRKASYVEHYGT